MNAYTYELNDDGTGLLIDKYNKKYLISEVNLDKHEFTIYFTLPAYDRFHKVDAVLKGPVSFDGIPQDGFQIFCEIFSKPVIMYGKSIDEIRSTTVNYLSMLLHDKKIEDGYGK